MQQHIRCRPKQKELPCARALAPSHVDLPTEGLEQVRHLLNLIEDNELADLFIQIEIGLCQDLSIRVSFQIEVYRRALRGYFKRKCCLANLPGSQHVIPLRAEQTPQEKVTFASKAPRRTRYLRAVRLGALRHMEWSILNTGHP
jgi:hypothetical protein